MGIKKRNTNRISKKTITEFENMSNTVDELTLKFDTKNHILRWVDDNNDIQEIYLASDNYPNLPSLLTNTQIGKHRRVDRGPKKHNYWFNYFPKYMLPLLEDVAKRLQELIVSGSVSKRKRSVRPRIQAMSIFFLWLIDDTDGPYPDYKRLTTVIEVSGQNVEVPHPEFPTSVSGISLELLRLYKAYLYEVHSPERLKKGLDNGKAWENGPSSLLNYLKVAYELDPSAIHHSIRKSVIPMFNRDGNTHKSRTEPYNEFETAFIYQCADEECKVIEHNWLVMREIENIPLKTNEPTLKNLSWYFVHVLGNALDEIEKTKLYASLVARCREKGVSVANFKANHSLKEIENYAIDGTYPLSFSYITTYMRRLNNTGKMLLARLALRNRFKEVIDVRQMLMTGKFSNWNDAELESAINIARNKLSHTHHPKERMKEIWEGAGLLDCFYPHNISDARKASQTYFSLFIHDIDSLYPFHLFTHLTSGLNREVITSLSRSIVLPDLQGDTVAYVGKKGKTGGAPRKEELSVPKSEFEMNGVSQRLEFVKSTTEPLLRFFSPKQKDMIWICIETQRLWKCTFLGNESLLLNAGSRFCLKHGLVEVVRENDGNEIGFKQLESIDPYRIRKSTLLIRAESGASYLEMLSALKDKSFDSLFKYYMSSQLQRRQNNQAIAAVQRTLLDEMRAYSINDLFQGQIGDGSEQKHAGESEMPSNQCDNRFDSSAHGQVSGESCRASFRSCLGCKQSRVFKQHLPVIAFMIIQYDEAKDKMDTEDWDTNYASYKLRAEDCLKRYSNKSANYSAHVDKAWEIARTDGGVYLPPLMV